MKILISGASIAGPSLAYWLIRYGHAVTVVEAAPGIRPGGHAVDIRGVATHVCERMDVMDAIHSKRVREDGIAWVDARGRRTLEMPATAFGGKGIVAEYEIMRGDLAEILYEATRRDVTYRFGDRITAIRETEAGVVISFHSGHVEEFDLVIGADGIHSGVRALAFGPEEQFLKRLGGYTAYFTVPAQGDLDPHWFFMHGAPAGPRSGGRCSAIRPENGDTAKAMLTFKATDLTYDRRDPNAQKQLLAEVFADMGWRTPGLINAMWDAPDFYFDVIGQVRMQTFTRGRVALLGDAGYCASPLSGLGTCLALVGGYVLAGELADADGDHRVAYAAYEAQMLPYITQCQQLPGGVNGMLPDSRIMINFRDLSMRMMLRWPLRLLTAKFFSKADAITVKNYDGTVRRPG